MADKKNLCAQIDIALHNRVTEEKDRLEMTTSQYIAALLTEYYKMKDENGGINMTGSRTMAFQIPEELFQRIKTHLARETARTGVKLTQRDFVLGLIEQALVEAEAYHGPSIIIAYAPCEMHSIKGGMVNCQAEMKKAVDCGYWNMFRYNPALQAEG